MLKDLIFSFVGQFVAMDVIGILPLYLAHTRSLEVSRKEKVVHQSVLVAGTVAFIFVFLGKFLFKILNVSIHDFKVGGGIVLLVFSILDLVKGKPTDDLKPSSGVVPLAVPLITGPALLTAVMLQVSLYGYFIVSVSLVLNFLFAAVALKKSNVITRYLGEEGTEIVSKIMALFMTAIAFSMIRTGIFEAIRTANL